MDIVWFELIYIDCSPASVGGDLKALLLASYVDLLYQSNSFKNHISDSIGLCITFVSLIKITLSMCVAVTGAVRKFVEPWVDWFSKTCDLLMHHSVERVIHVAIVLNHSAASVVSTVG